MVCININLFGGRDHNFTCVPRKTITIIITSNDNAKRAILLAITADKLKFLIIEIINRYCQRSANYLRCLPFQVMVNQIVVVSVQPNATANSITVVLSVPDFTPPSTSSIPHSFFRQLDTSDTASTIVVNSVTDSQASSGYSATDTTVTTDSSSSTGGGGSKSAASPSRLPIASSLLFAFVIFVVAATNKF